MAKRRTGMLVLGIVICAALCIMEHKETVSYVWNEVKRPVVVLDAGHGGIDGGAESEDGLVERDVNLAIVLELQKLLKKEDIKVVLTRSSDAALCGESGGTIRTHKVQDMYERKRIIDESEADLTISVHLNSFFQDTSVKGAQVFYTSYASDEIVNKSRTAAGIIQSELNSSVNVDKKRTEMAKNDVFILKEAQTPVVIAECGFLSNPDDAQALGGKEHQVKIAKSLKSGICKYLQENELNSQKIQ